MRYARACVFAALAALVVLLSAGIFGVAQLQLFTRSVLWVMWVMPLLLFLPGLLRGSWQSHLWLCFVILVYFTVTVSRLFGPRRDLADWLELASIVVLFVSAMLFARWRRRELGPQPGETSDHG
jgi:uncharacterized membrane protein